jgi:uncharacterized protein YndB with AHSA1/START domain
MTDLSLTVERVIDAERERVFNAWLDPKLLARFMVPAPGMSVPHATSEAREGGRFEITMQAGDDEIPHFGEYREISPHDRIVFTWESPFSAENSTVTLTFEPEGDKTRVVLTHVRFPDAESRDNHESGWGAILAALDETLR